MDFSLDMASIASSPSLAAAWPASFPTGWGHGGDLAAATLLAWKAPPQMLPVKRTPPVSKHAPLHIWHLEPCCVPRPAALRMALGTLRDLQLQFGAGGPDWPTNVDGKCHGHLGVPGRSAVQDHIG